MNLILPYNDNFYKGDGGFISPSNEIFLTYGKHEKFSRDFCQGNDYDFLQDIISGWSYYSTHFEEYKKIYNFNGTINDIDIYKSSKLTKEQLELYKLWLEENEFHRRKIYSDFMVYILGFDKVETIMRRTITTTNNSPHIRFYNYYLMNWNIEKQSPMKYNSEIKEFEYDEPKNWFIMYNEDRKYEEEINEIKRNVLVKDRHHYFK